MGDRENIYTDPRLLIAETYRVIKNKPELLKSFEHRLNKEIQSPEQAIDLCLDYQELALVDLDG
jgi:hypothetical protein